MCAALLLAWGCGDSLEVGSAGQEIAGGGEHSQPSSYSSAVLLDCDEQCLDYRGCTAAVLNKDTILSAAHCFEELGWLVTKESGTLAGEVTSMATDGQGLVFYGGDKIGATSRYAFVNDGVADRSPPAGTGSPSKIELMGNVGSHFYAVGWERNGEERQAFLYAFSDSVSFSSAHRILLGKGEPTAMATYLAPDGPHVAVALKSTLDVQGLARGRVFASAVDLSLADPGAPIKENIFYGKTEQVVSAIAVGEGPDGERELIFGGKRIRGAGSSPVVESWRAQLTAEEGWVRTAEYSAPTAQGALKDLVFGQGALFALFSDSSGAFVAKLGVTGMQAGLRISNDLLAGHYRIGNADGSSPYRTTKATPRLRPLGLTALDDRILLSGTLRLDGADRAVHIGLTENMDLDLDYEVRGIAIESFEYSYELRAVAGGVDNTVFGIGAGRTARGRSKLYRSTDDDLHAPTMTVRGAVVTTPVRFAHGVDLVMARLSTPLPDVSDLPIGPMSSPLTCVGGGTGSLRQGEVTFQPPLDTAQYSDSTKSRVYADGGDSGGPCFNAAGQLAGILVAGSEETTAAGTKGEITVVGSTALSDFVSASEDE